MPLFRKREKSKIVKKKNRMKKHTLFCVGVCKDTFFTRFFFARFGFVLAVALFFERKERKERKENNYQSIDRVSFVFIV